MKKVTTLELSTEDRNALYVAKNIISDIRDAVENNSELTEQLYAQLEDTITVIETEELFDVECLLETLLDSSFSIRSGS